MLRKNLYSILVLFTAFSFAIILVFAKKEPNHTSGLLERKGVIALSAEWLDTKSAIENLLSEINSNPSNFKAKLSLAQAYIQEARITGNHSYYDQVSLNLLEDVIKNDPKNFDALCCKATVLLSQHHFKEGLEVAKQAQKINPNSAFVYGIMCDAFVELGDYSEAVKMSDKMISIRPDNRSYARISYLREIHGDYPGAIEAAKLAVSAGYPGLEQTAWTRVILAHLYECIGCLDSAEYQYSTTLNERPDYAFAYAGLGRIAKANGEYKDAITYLEKAKSTITEYTFADELTDLYRLNNELNKSIKSSKEVITMLNPMVEEDETSSAHGHYADKELAYAYLKINDTANAFKHGLLEYKRRPNNIDICEAMAWIYYKKANYNEANKMINHALRTNSQNPTLLYRAGLIKINAGENEMGIQLIKRASNNQKKTSEVDLKIEATKYLKTI